MTEPRPEAVAWGKIITALLRAGWKPPPPGDRAVDRLTRDAASIEAPSLTRRQHEVLTLVAHGADLREAAAKLGISYETARGHMKEAIGRLGASSSAHAVALAVEQGLIEMAP